MARTDPDALLDQVRLDGLELGLQLVELGASPRADLLPPRVLRIAAEEVPERAVERLGLDNGEGRRANLVPKGGTRAIDLREAEEKATAFEWGEGG